MRRHLVGAVLVTVAACSSSSPTTNNTGSGSGGSGGGSNPPSGNVTAPVSITNYSFSPSSVTIKVGSSVAWTNNDPVDHTTTSDGGTWNSGQLSSATGGGAYGGTSAGGSYTYTFNSAGTFTYHCSNHTYMTGTVTVTP